MPRLYSYNNMLNSTLIKFTKTKRYYCKSWLTPWNKTHCSTAKHIKADYPQGIKNSGLPSTHGFMYNWHTSVASQDKSSSFYTWLYLDYEQLVHKCGLTRQLVFLPYMVLWTTGVQLTVASQDKYGLPSIHSFLNWCTSVASQDKWSSFHTWLYEQLVYS